MRELEQLKPAQGSRKSRKRIGRGPGSGHGKTSCKGHKGQKSRSGGSVPRGFEGGQMPLHRRLPKRGFTNIFKKRYALIHISDLNQFESGKVVGLKDYRKAGLLKSKVDGVKILGDGELSRPVIVKAHKFSRTAIQKIESAGGKAEVL
ncbi:50S ribosomal protein L15 [Thermodesulfobacteriota bacterium]